MIVPLMEVSLKLFQINNRQLQGFPNLKNKVLLNRI